MAIEENTTVEQTEDQQIRAEIAKEVFDGAEQSPPKDTEVAEALEAEPVIDKWKGIPTALREEFEALQSKLSGMDKLDGRLKQAEQRIGSVTNDLHAAREAAKTVSQAPTKEQIDSAATNLDEWNQLKEDWPEWTEATDKRLSALSADMLSRMPNTETLATKQEIADGKTETAKMFISMKHPDWRSVQETPEFAQWHAENGKKNSFNPIEVIAIFDEYETYQKTRKSSKVIAAERAERLNLAQNPNGRNLPPVKSEGDMTEAELRAAIGREVYS